MDNDGTKDFFISYNQADRAWAEWIAWQLEAEGYTTVLVNGLKVRRKMSVGRSCVEPSAKNFRGRRFDTIYTLWLIS